MPDIPPATLDLGLDYWRFTLPGYGVLAVGAVLCRALNGAGSTRTGLLIDIICYAVILMPAAALVSGAGLFGAMRGSSPHPNRAWAALVGVHALAAIIYVVVFLHGRWKHKEIALSRRIVDMTEKVGKPERLMNVLALLLASRTPVPFSSIAGRVIGYDDGAAPDALEKRFDRDRQDLRELGVEVEYAGETAEMPAGYFVRKDAVFQRKIAITNEEAMLLSVAARVGAAATGGGALFDALKGALRKLAVDTPLVEHPPGREAVGVLRVDAGDRMSRRLVAGLAEAIAREQRLKFRYRGMRDRDGELEAREPLRARDVPRRVVPRGLRPRPARDPRLQGRAGSPARWIRTPVRPRRRTPFPRTSGCRTTSRARPTTSGPRSRRRSSCASKGLPAGRRSLRAWSRRSSRTTATTSVVSVEVRRPLGLVPWVLSCGGDVEVVSPATLRAARPARGGGPVVSELKQQLDRALAVLAVAASRPEISLGEIAKRTHSEEGEVASDLFDTLSMCGTPPYLPHDYISCALEGDRVTVRFADQFRRPISLNPLEALSLKIAIESLTPPDEPTPRVVVDLLKKIEEGMSAQHRTRFRALAKSVVAKMPGAGGPMLARLREAVRGSRGGRARSRGARAQGGAPDACVRSGSSRGRATGISSRPSPRATVWFRSGSTGSPACARRARASSLPRTSSSRPSRRRRPSPTRGRTRPRSSGFEARRRAGSARSPRPGR